MAGMCFRLIVAWSLGVLSSFAWTSAQADSYPEKPVTIIASLTAGSGPDVVARIIAERLARIWGKQVLITNQAGAGGLIATRMAAAAVPDGYTLYMAASSVFIVLPETQAKLPFDLDRDFVQVGLVSEQPMVIAAASSLAVGTLADLIASARQRPGEILYSANTRGSLPHLTGELFRDRAGIDLTFVPYPGTPQALQDAIGGRVPVLVNGLSSLLGAIRGGSVKALAVASAKRLPNFPDLPTVAETLPAFEANGWFVLLAPAGTPKPVAHKVRQDLRTVVEQPEVKTRLETLGVYTRSMSEAELADFIRKEQAVWKPVIRQVGLTVP
jgi:tripartite-type tricarboxylate transporter receptor subunit TctC